MGPQFGAFIERCVQGHPSRTYFSQRLLHSKSSPRELKTLIFRHVMNSVALGGVIADSEDHSMVGLWEVIGTAFFKNRTVSVS